MNKKDSLAFLDECLKKLNSVSDEDIAHFNKIYEQNCSSYLLSDSFDFYEPLFAAEDVSGLFVPVSSLQDTIETDYAMKGKEAIDKFSFNQKEQTYETDDSLACAA